MSRNYNLLSIAFNTDYGQTQADFEEFLDKLSNRLGYYDLNKTIKCLTYDWCNNTPQEITDDYHTVMYVLTDWTQKISPKKLMQAFDKYWLGFEDEEDDDGNIIKSDYDFECEFLDNLAQKINNSELY